MQRPPDEWPALLDDDCDGDAELRHEVETLLQRQEHVENFLEEPPPPVPPAPAPPDDERMTDPLVGKEIDDYRILGVLGRGGMGVVYEAEDTALSRTVALKRINPELARDETFLRRFRSEARALARIDSSHITRVHALRNTDEGLFIVMEYVEGGTLADPLQRGPMDEAEALPLIKQMLRAFEDAHGAGVIHRDIKPQNIMLTPAGRVKVTDFGLARMRRRDAQATVTQGTAGTLNYMSPEQVKGLPSLDHRSDLYSLGITCYEMLAGRLPFDRDESDFSKMQSIVDKPFPPPEQFRAGLSGPLSGIIMKAMEKDPDARFQSAAEMREAVNALDVAGADRKNKKRSSAPRAAAGAAPAAGRAAVWGAGALVLLLLLAGGGYYFLTPDDAAPNDAALNDASAEDEASASALLSIATTPPGAAITLNGDTVDETPLRNYSVEAGTLSVRVRKSGYTPIDTTLLLAAARNARLNLTLNEQPQTPNPEPQTPNPKPATATLSLSAGPSVTVSVGGQSKKGGGDFRVPAGRHTARCRHPQYGTLQKTLTLGAGQSRALTCHFEQTINVNTAGPWGNIWINGKNTGRSTPGEVRRGPGTYRIAVRIERSDAYTVSGGVHRTTVGERSTMDEFSGGAATVEIEPSFAPRRHALVFEVNGGTQ